jgi:hypothetical protein
VAAEALGVARRDPVHRRLRALEAEHTIAIVPRHTYPPAKAYIARHQANGKTNKEALRALKRQLARRVFNILNLIAGRANNPHRIQISTPPPVPCLT